MMMNGAEDNEGEEQEENGKHTKEKDSTPLSMYMRVYFAH